MMVTMKKYIVAVRNAVRRKLTQDIAKKPVILRKIAPLREAERARCKKMNQKMRRQKKRPQKAENDERPIRVPGKITTENRFGTLSVSPGSIRRHGRSYGSKT